MVSRDAVLGYQLVARNKAGWRDTAILDMADMLLETMTMIATMPQPRPPWADRKLAEWRGEVDDAE